MYIDRIMKKHTVIPSSIHSPASRMFSLAFAHFLADMLGCMLPGFLPIALAYFDLSLGMGVLILCFTGIGSNLMQIPVALIDKTVRLPRMLLLGLALAGLIATLGLFPKWTPVPVLCLLMLLIGTGIALVHPFGLRGIQNLTNLPPTVTTPAFMTGGFFGSAVGPFLSALLVGSFGLKGLLWMLIPVVLSLLAVWLSNVKLAVDQVKKTASGVVSSLTIDPSAPWSFRGLMVIALLLNTGTATLQTLLPTYLYQSGFALSFGGLSAMLFGAGSTVGSVTMGFLAKRCRIAPFVIGCMILGVPLTGCYLYFSAYAWALPLVFFSGMFVSSGFPMMVFLARSAPGKKPLSARMAWIVGGTWGVAGLCVLVIGQFASKYGIGPVMNVVWIAYLCSLCSALILLRRNRNKPCCKKI